MNASRRLGAALALILAAAPAQAYVRPMTAFPGPHPHGLIKQRLAFGHDDRGHERRRDARWLGLGGWPYSDVGSASQTVYVPFPVAVPVEPVAYAAPYRSAGPRLIVLGGRTARRASVPKIVYGDPL